MQLSAEELIQRLPWQETIAAIKNIFTREVQAPIRHHHNISVPGEPEATLLLMPAWLEGEFLGVKQVNVFPGNSARKIPGLSSHYLLSCGKTGRPLIQLDGNELTARRTAAASALASSFLSRTDTSSMLMLGSGRMARRLIPAHLSVRPIESVKVWDRHQDNAEALVKELLTQGINASVCPSADLAQAAWQSDLISCATMATQPIIEGKWLKPGAHLDLVGSFTPAMRETDNNAMQIGKIFVDTRSGALSETGDLIIPIKEGAITPEDIVAEFSELCCGDHRGRTDLEDPESAITIFKSVGDSREDLAAAILAYQGS